MYYGLLVRRRVARRAADDVAAAANRVSGYDQSRAHATSLPRLHGSLSRVFHYNTILLCRMSDARRRAIHDNATVLY